MTKNNQLKLVFERIKREKPEMSLDEILYEVFEEVKGNYQESFDIIRNQILEANHIDELEYYTKNVNEDLKKFIQEIIFPEYEKNDGGHNLAHILEVIRRSFALNDTFKLGLDDNMIYTIAACHDWGKYEDHATHHLIAARNFMSEEGFKKFFTEEERKTIKEAIEDHRSSKEEEPRSIYGKLISSADRNTRIEIVFIRSFFVAQERMSEEIIEDYLDYTIKRLSKKYDEENPENMFFEDKTYKVFIQDMRDLLKKEKEFKDRYCEVNHIKSRSHKVKEEKGETSYAEMFKKKYKLMTADGKIVESSIPGTIGGNKKLKIYGRLDCPSANRWIAKGKYVKHRVFFENEDIAIAAGFRPCAVCMPEEYKRWKTNILKK